MFNQLKARLRMTDVFAFALLLSASCSIRHWPIPERVRPYTR